MKHDISRLLEAASFAAFKHSEQRRKDLNASPYINHPLKVASVLADVGGTTDVDLLVAALLHDTVEDTNTSMVEIVSRFGDAVGRLVDEVTDDKSLPKERRKELQIEKAPAKSARAKLLKIADKICNVTDLDADSPVDWTRERKFQYLDWSEEVVAGCRGENVTLDEQFDAAVHEARQRLPAGSD